MLFRNRSMPALCGALLALTLVLGTACAPRARVEEKATPPLNLALGLMPAIDIAPILVARDKGYFQAEGLELTFEIFPNAQVRQSAIQAGSVDGILTDLVALALSNAGGFPLKATTATDGYFAALAAPDQAARQGGALSIGLMEASVVNFLADLWLAGKFQLQKSWVPDPALRLEAVATGGIQAAILPEPLVSIGKARGLAVLAQSSPDQPSTQVLAFTELALADKAPAIQAFHRAWDKAIVDIKADPKLARDALAAALPNLSPAIAGTMSLPTWDQSRLPEEAWVQRVIDWTSGMTGKPLPLNAGDLVDRRFVAD